MSKKKTTKDDKELFMVDIMAKVSKLLVDQAYERGRAEAFAMAVQVATKGSFRNPTEVAAAIEQAAKAPIAAPGTPPKKGEMVQPDAGLPPSYSTGMNLFQPTGGFSGSGGT